MNRTKWTLGATALAIMIAGGGLILRLQATQRLGEPGVNLQVTGGGLKGEVLLPETLPGYTSAPQPITDLELGMLPADTSFGRRVYRGEDGFQALASVVLMGVDRTSIHQPEFCLVGQGWKIDSAVTDSVTISRPRAYALPVMRLQTVKQFPGPNGPTPMAGVYVYWFVSGEHLTASHEQRMWWMATELVKHQVLQRWAYVTFFAPCPPGAEDQTFARLQQLIALSVPEFQQVNHSSTPP